MQRAAVLAFVALLVSANVAWAHRMNCDPPQAPQSTAPTLQQILDGLVVSGPAINANAPLPIELWTNSAGPLTAQVVVNYTPESDSTYFGIYDPDTMAKAYLLSDLMGPDDVATVIFRDNATITVREGLIKGTEAGFEGPFGFFAKVFDPNQDPDTSFFYTQSALNDGPRAKVFQGDGTTTLKLAGLAPGLFLPNQFLIAWETGLGDANDGEFNDLLVLVTNIVPVLVPEPAFAFLLGISALAVVCGRRARST
jgi:hypothetical protein